MLQEKSFHRYPKVYGEQAGTPDDPAVTKESAHHFSKLVAGKPLQRPAWYYDTRQQGEAIVDVNTHLVDLVQWGRPSRMSRSLQQTSRWSKLRVWPTAVTLEQFKKSTGVGMWRSI